MADVWEIPAVQRGLAAQQTALQQRLDEPATLIGWKVGVGAPAGMAAAGIAAPLVGFLTTATVLADGATVSLGGWTKPGLEPELAIWTDRDVAPDASLEECAQAIGGIGQAIELADLDTPLTDLEGVVGGNIFHRAVILGPADGSRRGGQVDDLRLTVRRGDDAVATTDDVTALTGPPAQLVHHVVRWLAAAGRRLESGQVIIGGSIVPLLSGEPGDTVTYRCEPLGTLRVTFSD